MGAAAVLAGLTYLTVVDDVPLSERAAGPVASCANALWLATLIAPAIVAAYDGEPTWHPFGLALTGLLLCLVATAWRPVQVTLRRSRRRS